MGNQQKLPLRCECEFNDKAALLLQAAETIIYEECCSNGCVHKKHGSFLGKTVTASLGPTACRFFQPSDGQPIECATMMCELEKTKAVL